jgi:hypothetical protein
MALLKHLKSRGVHRFLLNTFNLKDRVTGITHSMQLLEPIQLNFVPRMILAHRITALPAMMLSPKENSVKGKENQ